MGKKGGREKNATLVVSVSLICWLRPPLKNTFVYFYCLRTKKQQNYVPVKRAFAGQKM